MMSEERVALELSFFVYKERKKMKKIQVLYKNIDDLIPYENNPRFNDDSVDKVANSIKEFGFKQPIVISKDNVIAAGHTRFKAAKKIVDIARGYIQAVGGFEKFAEWGLIK